MADDGLDELDITKVPGVIPILDSTPSWKRSMMEKKNQEKIDAYKVGWEKDREGRKSAAAKKHADDERRRQEEAKWAKLPEWKRKILQEKSRKDDQVRIEPAVSPPSAKPTKQPPPPPTASKPQKNEPHHNHPADNPPRKNAPHTKVPVLPPGPAAVPKKHGIPVQNPAPNPRDSLPVSAVTAVDDTHFNAYTPPPVLVSKTTPTSLKVAPTGKAAHCKHTLRVIKKGTGSM